MNLKNKETQLFETLNKLDSIADLIKNSKQESNYLKKISSQLEKEKEELHQKSINLEQENNSEINEIKIFEQIINREGISNQEILNKSDLIEKENKSIKDELFKMETELEEARYKIRETENINKNITEEFNSAQSELKSTKEQLDQILKHKKKFVKKTDEISHETYNRLGEFDKW